MKIEIKQGDCLKKMREMGSDSVNSVLCDPPYGLKFLGKSFDDLGEGKQQREWHVQWLREAHRVLKEGGIIRAFSSSRTVHHLLGAMNDVGFCDVSVEIWWHKEGLPKSLNVSKTIDKQKGLKQPIIGYRPIAYSDSDCWGVPNKNGLSNGYMFGLGQVGIGGVRPVYGSVSPEAKAWEGFGSNLKPSFEPIVVGVKR